MGDRPSLLNPFWYAGAFAIGLAAGRTGDDRSLGFVFFGLIADRACIAEPAQLVERLGPEFEQLLLATTVGVLGLQRRKPRRRKRAAQPAGNT